MTKYYIIICGCILALIVIGLLIKKKPPEPPIYRYHIGGLYIEESATEKEIEQGLTEFIRRRNAQNTKKNI